MFYWMAITCCPYPISHCWLHSVAFEENLYESLISNSGKLRKLFIWCLGLMKLAPMLQREGSAAGSSMNLLACVYSMKNVMELLSVDVSWAADSSTNSSSCCKVGNILVCVQNFHFIYYWQILAFMYINQQPVYRLLPPDTSKMK